MGAITLTICTPEFHVVCTFSLPPVTMDVVAPLPSWAARIAFDIVTALFLTVRKWVVLEPARRRAFKSGQFCYFSATPLPADPIRACELGLSRLCQQPKRATMLPRVQSVVLVCAVVAVLAGSCAASDVVQLTSANFEKLVLKSQDYWLVEFYAVRTPCAWGRCSHDSRARVDAVLLWRGRHSWGCGTAW